MDEPKHPTYGTLDEFLEALARDIRDGYYIRIGQQGALNWFSEQHGQRRAHSGSGEHE